MAWRPLQAPRPFVAAALEAPKPLEPPQGCGGSWSPLGSFASRGSLGVGRGCLAPAWKAGFQKALTGLRFPNFEGRPEINDFLSVCTCKSFVDFILYANPRDSPVAWGEEQSGSSPLSS